MTDTAAKAAKEILKLLPRSLMMDTWIKNQDKLATIIQRLLDERDKIIVDQAAEIERLKAEIETLKFGAKILIRETDNGI